MQDTLMTAIGIFIAVILIFMFPLMEIAGKTDELSETVIELAASDFVNNVAQQGKITELEYSSLIQKINATGNTYEVEIEARILDDNPSRITTTGSSTLIGENKYYSVYTNTIIEKLQTGQDYYLKTNDYIILTIKNANTTMGSQLRSFMYQLMGQQSPIVATKISSAVLEQNEKPVVQIGTAPVIQDIPQPTPEPTPKPDEPHEDDEPPSTSLENFSWVKDYYWVNDDTEEWLTGDDYKKKKLHPGYNKSGDRKEYGVWDGSISRIRIKERDEGENADTIEMIGNSRFAGKGATWATIEGNEKLKSLEFEYNLEQGDSFRTAGVIINLSGGVEEFSTEPLKGYYISLVMYKPIEKLAYNIPNAVKNNTLDPNVFNSVVSQLYGPSTAAYTNIASFNDANKFMLSGVVWEFTYNKGNIINRRQNNGKVFESLKPIMVFDAGAEVYDKQSSHDCIRFSGKISIEATNSGYRITVDNKNTIFSEEILTNTLNLKNFGFVSEHYDHGCTKIGYCKFYNVRVTTE